jgi:hypothetical protein
VKTVSAGMSVGMARIHHLVVEKRETSMVKINPFSTGKAALHCHT